ncbi:N-acetylmuramoyl-L-alanine amidase family protein [Alkalihalobacillus sp. 1P02AB]|uniref:N-acetylmuramoyl-L-alanine amidase family protein n=1 Tax=Alkalihalobacillus sp. 1P02AB TaxID=3132260 RepID=UPI0039A71581
MRSRFWFIFIIVMVIPFIQIENVKAYWKPTYDVVIDVGHGGVDGGTSIKGILEKEINLQFGLELYEELKGDSYRVAITRIHDYALSDDYIGRRASRHQKDLLQRTMIVNSLKPKVFLSLHVNWAKNRQAHGPIVIYQKSEKSLFLAEVIQNHLNSYYETKRSPIKGKKYYLMNHTETASVIVELGFLSNGNDRAMMLDEQKRTEIVKALSSALEEYFTLILIDEVE